MADSIPKEQPTWLTQIVDKIDKMNISVLNLTKRLNDIQTTADFAADIALQKATKTEDEINELKAENMYLKSEIERLEKSQVRLESHSRRNNLIFGGINEMENETWDQCEASVKEILSKCMQLDGVLFERVHRLGSKTQGKTREIIAKFSTYKQRDQT